MRWPTPLAPLLAALVIAQAGCGFDEAATGNPAGAADAGRAPAGAHFDVRLVASGFVRPTQVASAPGDERGLWVLEQTGRLRRLAGGRRTTVLDLRSQVSVGAERGLLGVAFHPDFASNRRLFVNYTNRAGDTRVEEHRLGAAHRALPGSQRELLAVDQPEENHNGGALLFGPDGRLYVGMGDGGGAFDPRRLAQNPRSRLGKLLRADVDRPGAPRWEPVLIGLRNPWRFWFDPASEEVWLGDVGQDQFEEIDRVPLEHDEPPKNLGWPALEGDRQVARSALSGGGELVGPVVVYGRDQGCSVIGGLIYRGTVVAALSERYVFGDFCTGRLWTVRPEPAGRVRDLTAEAVRLPQLTSIGTDPRGELLFATADGKIHRAVPR